MPFYFRQTRTPSPKPSRVRENRNAKRRAYAIWGHNCGIFICDALSKTIKQSMTDLYGTPQQVLARLWLLHLLNSTTYSYNPSKKMGERAKVSSTIQFDKVVEDQQ